MGQEVPATTRVGFIGAGQMSEALARGLVKAGILPADRISASNGSRKAIFESFGVTVCSNAEVVEKSNVVIIAVKPQILRTVLTELRPQLTKDHLLVSIAAGITIDSLQQWGGDVRVVRVIPNTPCVVGEGAAALSVGASANQGDLDLVKVLFDAIGTTVVVEEKLLNAVTGVSGSGPAFVYIAIEAMADGGVAAGLPRATALSLAAQTFLGSAKMVLETKKHPGQLKDDVASPAGTTIAGIHELEKAGFRAAWMNAVLATAKRGEQLASASK
ncbi:unnamed protein product [Calypogeia fissa]